MILDCIYGYKIVGKNMRLSCGIFGLRIVMINGC
jgi:hypothetical protein